MHGALRKTPQARCCRCRGVVPSGQQAGASCTEGGKCRVRESPASAAGKRSSACERREAARERSPRCSTQAALSCRRPRAWSSLVRLIGFIAVLVHLSEAPIHCLHDGGRLELPGLRDAVEPRIPHALWGLWGKAQERCGGDPNGQGYGRHAGRTSEGCRCCGSWERNVPAGDAKVAITQESWWQICLDRV